MCEVASFLKPHVLGPGVSPLASLDAHGPVLSADLCKELVNSSPENLFEGDVSDQDTARGGSLLHTPRPRQPLRFSNLLRSHQLLQRVTGVSVFLPLLR